MYEVNFEIPAFFLSIVCFLYCITAKQRQYIPPKTVKAKLTSQHFTFLVMLVANMLSAISSIIGVYIANSNTPSVYFWKYFFHACYFFFHSTLSIAFALYIINVTSTNSNWKKMHYIIFTIPYILAELLVLTNPLTNWSFYFDNDLIYRRGILMPVLYGLGGLYVVIGFFFFIKNKKAISKVDSIAVATFIIVATAGIIIQGIKSAFLVELFSEALACLILMVVLEEKSGHVDITTGLLNRVAFAEANKRLMATNQEYNIVLIKLNEIDKFIRRFGGREVEEFLMNVASFISKEANVIDVYSYRRESFAVIFKYAKEKQVIKFIETIIDRFEKNWQISSVEIKTDVIATLIKIPQDYSSYDDFKNILVLDYKKEKSGSYFVPLIEIKKISNSSLYESLLKKAIEEDKLELKYQPIWSIKEKMTVSAEALLRVNLDELKDISPEVYIPIAEKTGLIREIGYIVFEKVCEFLSDERFKKSNIEYVELNLSTYQFMYNDLIDRFEEIRKKYNVPAKLINLEITETAATLDEDVVLNSLNRFLELGYTLSLDDFGTGYSNMVRMIGSNYRNIKIDKSILWNAMKNGTNEKTLKNLSVFIKSLGFDIIQEGVETKKQLELVTKCGCDYIQGFYFSKPIPKDEFFEYIKNEAKSLKYKKEDLEKD